MIRHGLLVTFLGKLQDRFCEYQRPMPLLEKLEAAASIRGVAGVELIYPNECLEQVDIQAALTRLGLAPAAINVNIKGDSTFTGGALTSPDAQVRRRAVTYIVEAKQFAARLGCERVTCAPLADGFDYPFQVNYKSVWIRLVECLREAAEAVPEVCLHLEHKPAEPRVRSLLDSAAKVVKLCRDVDRQGVGVTFNTGHCLVGGGSPASEFALVLHESLPVYVHFNDATIDWDWDLIAGSHRFWELLEFLLYAREAEAGGWFTADTLPLRQDALEVFGRNIRLTRRIWEWLGSAEGMSLRESVFQRDKPVELREMAEWLLRS